MAGRRAADWRFPTPRQQRAEETARRLADAQRARVSADDSEAWWASVLSDPRAATMRPSPAKTLARFRRRSFAVECQRCFWVVEELRRDLVARWARTPHGAAAASGC